MQNAMFLVKGTRASSRPAQLACGETRGWVRKRGCKPYQGQLTVIEATPGVHSRKGAGHCLPAVHFCAAAPLHWPCQSRPARIP